MATLETLSGQRGSERASHDTGAGRDLKNAGQGSPSQTLDDSAAYGLKISGTKYISYRFGIEPAKMMSPSGLLILKPLALPPARYGDNKTSCQPRE